MKVRYIDSGALGMELISENIIDVEILRRFFDKGVKVNSITNGGESLGLTFKDLIK